MNCSCSWSTNISRCSCVNSFPSAVILIVIEGIVYLQLRISQVSKAIHKVAVILIEERHIVILVLGPMGVVLGLLPDLHQFPILPHRAGGAIPLPQKPTHGVDLIIEANDFGLECIDFVVAVHAQSIHHKKGKSNLFG